jgi:hypothetical protein
MKIKEILGEAGGSVATIKDYKPGQSLSFTDQEGSTMTTVDLKKNPMAVKPNEQGELTYDPTPDTQAAAPGQSQAPEIKPGAQIQIDTATTEGSGDKIEDMFDDWMNSEYAPYDDDSGDDKAVFIKALNFVADRMDNSSDSESYAYKLADMFHGSGDYGDQEPHDEFASDTFSDDDKEDKMPSRMDESAYITALAKRVAGTDAKVSKSANKSIADIRKLAGL